MLMKLVYKFPILIISLLFCFQTINAQERDDSLHAFKVYVKDSNGTRIDIPENEHVSFKTTGLVAFKHKCFFLGLESQTKLTGYDDLYIQINDTVELVPECFRLMRLREKKGNREMTCWSASIFGARDSSKDYIPSIIYPIDDTNFRISLKGLPPGHYAIMYQIGIRILVEFYDFDL